MFDKALNTYVSLSIISHRSLNSMYRHLNIYLPIHRNIAFEDITTESGQCVFQRAWEDLLPNNRILIYCMYDLFSAVN